MKTCFKCGGEKSLSDFYAHPGMADGRLNKCKTCTKIDAGAHRAANIEKARAYDRARASTPARRSASAATIRRWQAQHPDRRAAQIALGNAVRAGRLAPWPACALPSCDSTKTEAHHADYSRPLDVVWLCSPHHKQAHALFTRLIAN